MSTKTMRTIHLVASAAFVASTISFAGCGGGASEQPTVVLKAREGGSGGGHIDGPPPTPTPANGGPAPAGGFGGWKGKVVFGGTLPQLPPLIAQGDATAKDPAVCAAQPVPNQRLVGQDGGVANVFIYLRSAPSGAAAAEAPSEEAVFDQKGCVFLPHAMFVRTDQPIRVLSDDPIAHNTHTFPKRNSSFNQVIGASDRTGVTFQYSRAESEPVSVKCDFHAWMQAYHLPLDHPFAAVSAADGSFEFPDLPAGTHEFMVWHEGVRGGFLTRAFKVTVQADQSVEQNIDYPADKFAANAENGARTIVLSSLIRK
ncbi:MAG: carboxypeptidase regulatory-like domain-containing protein [Planctomycetaceae bacterium]